MNRLVDFILEGARIPNSTLDMQALMVRDHLAFVLQPLGVLPLEGSEFTTWALQCLCQDGTPTGIALRPASADIAHKRRPGQARRIRRGAVLPPRTIRSEPIICTIIRCLTKEAARRNPALEADLPFIEKVLAVSASELDCLSQQPELVLLQHRPRSTDNRVLELHLETCGYPAYGPFSTPMHLGLIARIEQQSKMPPNKREHNLCTYLTSPKAIIPIFPTTLVKPALVDYGTPEQLGSLLLQVVRNLVGIKKATQLDYVMKFLHLVYGCARDQGAIERAGKRLRKLRQPLQVLPAEADQEPEEYLDELPSHKEWVKACEETYRKSGVPVLPLPEAVLDSPDAEAEALSVVELPHQTEKCVRHLTRFARHRLVQDRFLDEAAPGVLPLDELAMYLACVQDRTIGCNLNHTSQRVFLELLIGIGQSAERLANIVIGRRAETPLRCPNPVYDSRRGSLSFVPHCYVYLPNRLRPPLLDGSADKEAIRRWRSEWQNQQIAYTPTTPVHEILLPPPLRATVEQLLETREQALHQYRRGENTNVRSNSGPLFLLVSKDRLRVWSNRDTSLFVQKLNSFAARWHPDWPALRITQFPRTAFFRYVARYGLDPVYAWYITDYAIDFLEMPLRYTLVRGDELTRAYWDAFCSLQADLIETYRIAWNKRFPFTTPLADLDWDTENIPAYGLRFGTPHHPRPEILVRLIRGLIELCRDEDPRTAYNARVTLVLLLLTISTGVRPTEEMNSLDDWIDDADGTYSMRGKSNFDHEAYRRLPLPTECMPLLTHVLRQCRLLADRIGQQPAFWTFEQDTPVPARSTLIRACLLEAGRRAGLADDQIPSHHSARSFFRSFAPRVGVTFDAINALMGHQSTGRERYNPFLPHPLTGCENLEFTLGSDPLFDAGRRLASQILNWIGVCRRDLEIADEGE